MAQALLHQLRAEGHEVTVMGECSGASCDYPDVAWVVASAVANAEQAARAANTSLDVDALVITKAIVNEGPKLKRWMPAAMGRATPIAKRTSHIEIIVAEAVR